MIRYYAYQRCSTCRNAQKWLDEHQVEYQEIAIREQTPSIEELRSMYQAKGKIKALFNTSGMDYRALGLKDKLPKMTDEEALELLTTNGMLVKRPFVIGDGTHLLGFKEAEWEAAL